MAYLKIASIKQIRHPSGAAQLASLGYFLQFFIILGAAMYEDEKYGTGKVPSNFWFDLIG
jgi:hypothetical protein